MSFRALGLATIIATYFLILVGGFVRATGSGMGCPDWPKCFGSWVPPTEEAQLPPFYQEEFLAKRIKKNERLAKMLSGLGFHNAADKIVNDPSIHVDEPFNATKTWIEYINRLIGALIGLLIAGTFLKSFSVRSIDRRIPWLTGLSVLVVLFQAWLGSIVVSANLLPFTITVHMLMALVLVGLLIYAIALAIPRAKTKVSPAERVTLNIALVYFGFVVLQIVLGTQVREEVDMLTKQFGFAGRGDHAEMLGRSFIFHRSLSWILAAGAAFLFYRVNKVHGANIYWKAGVVGSVVCVIISLITGVALAWFGLPAWSQPIHLLTGSLLAGFILLIFFTRKFAPQFGNVAVR